MTDSNTTTPQVAQLEAIIKDLRGTMSTYETILAHFAVTLDVDVSRLADDGLPRLVEWKRKAGE